MSRRRRHAIPKPAHPTDRREPLPWERPKSLDEDAEVSLRLREIMGHPSYAEADRDVDFLHTDGVRGVRLHVDYLKAELGLTARDIRHCVVVFGSTRLREPGTAKCELDMARREHEARPGDALREKALRLAERRVELSRYYEVGRELGRLVGVAARQRGDSHLAIMTGGGPGGMEAANRGSYEAGADTIGLNITLPREQYPNPYLTPGLCYQFHYFAMRKLHFMKRAAAIVALPGGYGTLDELFGALTLIQTRKTKPFPIVLIGEEYWRKVFDIDFLAESGSIDEEDRDLFWYAETAVEAWDGIRDWHKTNGTSLFNGTPE